MSWMGKVLDSWKFNKLPEDVQKTYLYFGLALEGDERLVDKDTVKAGMDIYGYQAVKELEDEGYIVMNDDGTVEIVEVTV